MMPAASDWLALGAAACWAVGAVSSVTPSRHLGAVAFSRWRLSLVIGLLGLAIALSGRWQPVRTPELIALASSGLIGVFAGDIALFGAVNRLGPRRAGVLYASHALMSALLGFVLLGERMGAQALLGAALVVGGVMWAIVGGHHKDESHAWEINHGPLGAGVALALLAALCQALGALIAKPVMAAGVDPLVAAALRVGAALAVHLGLRALGWGPERVRQPLSLGVLAQTGFNGLIAMALGMTLLLAALHGGDVGLVGVLSSVSPVLVLPLLWWQLGRAPAAGAWAGAVFTVAGTALLLARG